MSQYYPDLSGNNRYGGITVGDPRTNKDAQPDYILASNLSLSPTSRSVPMTGLIGGSYIFFASFTGTSIQLQYLGDDGAWYNAGDARVANGAGAAGVVLGQDSTVALYNPNGTSVTGIYARLS